MKSNPYRFCHKKAGSPVKNNRLVTSLLCPFAKSMQRNNHLRRSSPQERMDSIRSRRSNDSMSMEFDSVNSPFHTHAHSHVMAALPPLSCGPWSAEGSERTPNVWPPNAWPPNFHQFNSHLTSSTPQSPSSGGQSSNLLSPPKPHRVASAATPPVPAPSYPVQARYEPSHVPRSIKPSTITLFHQVIGDPALKIFRVRLPPHLLHLLDGIVLGCEAHAATLPKGWITELYSLTKQDMALRRMPRLYDASKPITVYIKRCMLALLRVKAIKMDKNQPHVLKYSVENGNTGVELHHDKCDVTANVCLSRSSSYVGGGTFFPAAHEVVRLEFGEFLIHPGSLVHGGMNILHGTRHLMIFFANIRERF